MIGIYGNKSQTKKIISALIIIAMILSLVSPIHFAIEEDQEEVLPLVEEHEAEEPPEAEEEPGDPPGPEPPEEEVAPEPEVEDPIEEEPEQEAEGEPEQEPEAEEPEAEEEPELEEEPQEEAEEEQELEEEPEPEPEEEQELEEEPEEEPEEAEEEPEQEPEDDEELVEEEDESEIDDSDINEDELEEEMMEIAPFAGIGDTFPQVKNYFEAIGNSTNDHYSVVGVYIASNDDVHLILDNDKNTANQVRFHSPMLNGSGAAGFGLNFGNYESYWDEIGTSLTLNFSDGSTNVITGVRLFDFNLGPMTENLQETNTLQMLNQADGFSIRGMSFTLNLDYQIDKKVNGLDAITSSPGEEVIYTVTVSNSGQYLLSGINVFDDVPLGLTILEVSTDNVNWSNANFNSSGDIILDSGLTLAVGGSKTYYVKALVNEDVDHGDIITNTAYVNGSVPRKEANASITVENSTIDLTIKKFVSGNFGDLSQAFPFIVTLDNGDAYNFELSDGQSKTLEEIPENSILTLKEDVSGYEVTLVVDGDEVLSNPDGSYTISVAHMEDATIEVTNHKDVDINTGISLDSMPYLMLLAVAVISLGVKIVHKGRIKD